MKVDEEQTSQIERASVAVEAPDLVSGLLPCPLCGSKNLFLRDIAGWELDCRDCELSLVLANDPSREGLIARWNTRNAPARDAGTTTKR